MNDVDKTAEIVQANGGKLLLPPTDISTIGRCCVFQNPQGAVLSVITL